MFLRRKASQGHLLEELQQTYNDVCDSSVRNLALEEEQQFGDALKGWKSLHTLLLYKIDVFERKFYKLSPEETQLLTDLKDIRDENVKHLVRIQLRLDEQTRRAQRAHGDALPGPSHGGNPHKLTIPSLRNSGHSTRSLGLNTQRHMVKSLRNGNSTYQMLPQNRDTVKAAVARSWPKPPQAKKPVYEDDMFGDFDQTEIAAADWDKLNSITSSSTTGSDSSINLIDIDDRPETLPRSFDDLTLKKKVPPPVPPKRGALLAPRPPDQSLSVSPPKTRTPAKPVLPVASKSTPDVRDIPEPKTYTYKQPAPLNINKMMQSAKKTRPTPTPSQGPKARTTEAVVRAKPKPQPKKSNITYNYKPLEKPKAVKKAPAAARPKPVASPKLPEEAEPLEEDAVFELTASGDMSAEEQSALIRSIKGIDELSATQILNDIVVRGDEVYWEDIVGLDAAKNSLKEAVVYPFLRPDLFRGLREPTRGMLLFGPPGTGKTMLARAVATESKSTFFSISSSSLTSKYLGESEKLVKALFLLAKKLSPSIVFIDEIDSLLGTRTEGEVESMRRIKNEFLVQWSELSSAAAGRDSTDGDVSRVLILGATNLPWGIDEAARRRFAKRVYIPLPERETRKMQISKLLAYQNHTLLDNDFARLMDLTEGFSGSDITLLAKDSAMGPLRSLGDKLLSTPTEDIRPINIDDFVESLKYIRPSVSSEGLGEYENWAGKFGSSGA